MSATCVFCLPNWVGKGWGGLGHPLASRRQNVIPTEGLPDRIDRPPGAAFADGRKIKEEIP